MTKLEQMNAKIDELIKDESDTSRIEALSKLKNLGTEAQSEEAELLKKHSELTTSYKNLILNSPQTKDVGKEEGGYKAPPQMPNFEDFFKEESKKLEKGK